MYKVNIEQTALPEDNFNPKVKVEITHDKANGPIFEGIINLVALQDVTALYDDKCEMLDDVIALIRKNQPDG